MDVETIRSTETLRKIEALAQTLPYLFIAMADADRLPHVAPAGKLTLTPQGHILASDWFCPGTMDNVRQNPSVAVVVWHAAVDMGYQLLGEVEQVEEVGMLDGYVPGEEGRPPMPQVKRELSSAWAGSSPSRTLHILIYRSEGGETIDLHAARWRCSRSSEEHV